MEKKSKLKVKIDPRSIFNALVNFLSGKNIGQDRDQDRENEEKTDPGEPAADFYVCIHPDHHSMLELMTKKEYLASIQRDDAYQAIFACSGREEALSFVYEVLMNALRIDPGLVRLKQDIGELYGKA